MTANDFRRIALSMAGAVEGSHMGHADFRASGKGGIFASLAPDGTTGNVKLMPEQQRAVMDAHPEAFTPAPGGWGRQGWTTALLKHVTVRALTSAIRAAWENVAVEPVPEKTTVKRKATTRRGASSRKKLD